GPHFLRGHGVGDGAAQLTGLAAVRVGPAGRAAVALEEAAVRAPAGRRGGPFPSVLNGKRCRVGSVAVAVRGSLAHGLPPGSLARLRPALRRRPVLCRLLPSL